MQDNLDPQDDTEDYDSLEYLGGPYELRTCHLCGHMINEDDPGVVATTGDGDEVIVCTWHLEQMGALTEVQE